MSKKVSIDRTCGKCALYDNGWCKREKLAVPSVKYACDNFLTPEQLAAQIAQWKQERMRKEEHRLNMLLTGIYISATSTQMLLEYFDSEFVDRSIESNWRFSRKRAANEIMRCAQRIRDLFTHTFMEDQTQVMTDHGRSAFDVVAYDSHEDDARRWARRLLYDLDRSWGNDDIEDKIDEFYMSLPGNDTFAERDYRHFDTIRK